MSESFEGGMPSAHGADPRQPAGNVEAAKHEASELKSTATEQAAGVVETAKSEAGAVAHEAKTQVRDLYRQTRSELKEQAAVQQRRVAEGLRSVGGELGSMADSADGGVAADLVRQVSTKVQGVAGWLGDRDPGSLLGEVKSYARRRPGTFIAAAALAGLVAGRLARALGESAADSAGSTSGGASGSTASGSMASGSATPSGSTASGSTASGAASEAAWASAAVAGGTATDVATGVATGGAHPTGAASAAGSYDPDDELGATVGSSMESEGDDIPPAPDGIDGQDAGTSSFEAASDTPLYDQTDAATRDAYGEERP